MIWWNWSYKSIQQYAGVVEEVGIVEGDYNTWTLEWMEPLDGGLSSEYRIDWVIDDSDNVITIGWQDSDNSKYRFGVFNLDDFSTVFLSNTAINYSSDCPYNSVDKGINFGGAITDFRFSRSIQTYVIFGRADNKTYEVWRGGATPLKSFIPSDDFSSPAPYPTVGISLTGKHIIAANDVSGEIACYKGSYT